MRRSLPVFEVLARDAKCLAAKVVRVQPDQSLRRLEGKSMKERRIHHGEDGSVCANSDGQGQNRRDRHPALTAQPSQRLAGIAPDVIPHSHAQRFPTLLPDPNRISKRTPNRDVCGGGAHPAPTKFLFLLLHVKPQFRIHLTLGSTASNPSRPLTTKHQQPAHGRQTARTTTFTALESRLQVA